MTLLDMLLVGKLPCDQIDRQALAPRIHQIITEISVFLVAQTTITLFFCFCTNRDIFTHPLLRRITVSVKEVRRLLAQPATQTTITGLVAAPPVSGMSMMAHQTKLSRLLRTAILTNPSDHIGALLLASAPCHGSGLSFQQILGKQTKCRTKLNKSKQTRLEKSTGATWQTSPSAPVSYVATCNCARSAAAMTACAASPLAPAGADRPSCRCRGDCASRCRSPRWSHHHPQFQWSAEHSPPCGGLLPAYRIRADRTIPPSSRGTDWQRVWTCYHIPSFRYPAYAGLSCMAPLAAH